MPKCGGCKNYFPKDELRPVGIQNFCGSCSPTGIKATPMKAKPKKNPMPSDLRAEVVAADGGRCRFCGTTQDLHVHHVVYGAGRREHVRSNLITLCQEHHMTVHSDKGKYQTLCQQVIKLRDERGDKQITIARIM